MIDHSIDPTPDEMREIEALVLTAFERPDNVSSVALREWWQPRIRRIALFVRSVRRDARNKALQDFAAHVVDEFEEPFSIRECLEAIRDLQVRP